MSIICLMVFEIDEVRKQVEKLTWWHRIDLGNGIITPGKVDTFAKLKTLGLPENLKGKTILDVGAWDGFYSFEAERRGASRVLATDSVAWDKNQWNLKDGFNLARKILKSKVEDKNIDILELSPDKIGTFDVVICLGVLYHMRHPLLSLEKIFSVTKDMAIIETATDMLDFDRPALAFYPGKELNAEQSNWFGPNPAAVEAMLKSAGFSKAELFYQSKVGYRETGKPGPAPYDASSKIPASRVVFHAWR